MEIVDLFDDKRRKLNKNWIRENGTPNQGEFVQVVHIWIMNDNGDLLIQKRQENVRNHAQKWAYTAGAVDAGESSLEGAIREAKEELGIDLKENKVEFLLSFKRKKNYVDGLLKIILN